MEPVRNPPEKVGRELDASNLLPDTRQHRGFEAVEIVVESPKDLLARQMPVLAHCAPSEDRPSRALSGSAIEPLRPNSAARNWIALRGKHPSLRPDNGAQES
jgi:hypothetical protein